MVWADFEVGFGISAKNDADTWPQVMVWSKFGRFFIDFFVYFLIYEGSGASKSNAA